MTEQGVSIQSETQQDTPTGVRFLDADGHLVAELDAGQADGGTWLLSNGSVCPDFVDRSS